MTHKTLVKKNDKGEVIATVRLLGNHFHLLHEKNTWEEVDDTPDSKDHKKFYPKGV